MFIHLADSDGGELDAKVELEAGSIIFHSRGGAFGKPNLRNPDYRKALRLALQRLGKGSLKPSGVWLDSRVAQSWPKPERLLVREEEFGLPLNELVMLIGQRRAEKGRTEGSAGHGNSTKRIRIGVPGASVTQLTQVLRAFVPPSPLPDQILDDERTWAEGSLKRKEHLSRDRASGLSRAKKEDFVKRYGRLICERCCFVPSEELGPLGDACIEVHHNATAVAKMRRLTNTRLVDLQCLCANCHKIIHREQF